MDTYQFFNETPQYSPSHPSGKGKPTKQRCNNCDKSRKFCDKNDPCSRCRGLGRNCSYDRSNMTKALPSPLATEEWATEERARKRQNIDHDHEDNGNDFMFGSNIQDLAEMIRQLQQLRSRNIELETDKGKFDQLVARNLLLELEKESHTADLNKLSKREKELVESNLLLDVENETHIAELNKLSKRNKELKSEVRKSQQEINRLLARNQELETELERHKLELEVVGSYDTELDAGG